MSDTDTSAEPKRGVTPPKADARESSSLDPDATSTPHRPPRWWGAVVGLLAAGAGLAAGQVVADLDTDLHNPVLTVGDRVIDWVPKWMKEFAVNNFGTSDKTVLLWTISVVIAVTSLFVGMATVRGRWRLGLIFAAVFGFLGATAGSIGRNTKSGGALPSLFAGLVAGWVLFFGYRLTHPKPVRRVARPHTATRQRPASPATPAPIDRRRFLTLTGSIAAAAGVAVLLGAKLQTGTQNVLQKVGVRRPVPKVPLPAPPADPALLAGNEGLSKLITPINTFYRIDTALYFPNIDLGSWRLKVTGMVNREMTYTYDDLLSRELIERDITISCVSNEVGGDLVGNARWVGCRLDDLLLEAGIKSGADQVLGVSDDGFTAGFPVETLDGRDAMIALGMDGDVLPVKNGFPARIIVPGIYGYVSAVKWLTEIRLTTFAADQGYWVPRGWAARAPIKTQSRIDRPLGNVPPGTTAIAGVAWAPTRGISKVEVQVDDTPWVVATLGPSLGKNAWVQWWTPWNAVTGRHQIRVRATDGTGATQTEELSAVDPDGATGWHTITMGVNAN